MDTELNTEDFIREILGSKSDNISQREIVIFLKHLSQLALEIEDKGMHENLEKYLDAIRILGVFMMRKEKEIT